LIKSAQQKTNKQETPESEQIAAALQVTQLFNPETPGNGGNEQEMPADLAAGIAKKETAATGDSAPGVGAPAAGWLRNGGSGAFSSDGSTAHEMTGLADPRPQKSAIQANVDGIDSRGNITGWGWAPEKPEQRLDVTAYIGEEVVSFGTANLPRADVKEAGHGDGSYGFSLPLSDALLDGKPRPFSIRFEGSGTEPFAIEGELRPPFRAVRGPSAAPKAEEPVGSAPPALPGGAHARGAPVYVPGQYVICTTPYPRPPYHVDGWYEPEEEFTWIRGGEGVIEMLLRRPLGAYTFTLDVVPNGVGGRLQTLEIFFNYFRVGFFEVTEPRTVSVELPAEIFILRKTRINLHCRNAVTPSEHGIPDDRRLGIAVSGWCII